MKRVVSVVCLLLSALLLLPAATAAFAAADQSDNVPKTYLPARVKPEYTVTKLDFSDQMMSSYIRNEKLSVGNRASMDLTAGNLRNSASQPMSFGSGVFVGDDYGNSEGYVSMKMNVTSGKISLGVRNTRAGQYTDSRGIWFDFDGSDNITVYENDTGSAGQIKAPKALSGEFTVRFDEQIDKMYLSVDGERLAEMSIEGGLLTVTGAPGETVISKDGCGLYDSGYFTVVIDGDTDGYVDDIEFSHYTVDQSLPEREDRKIDYSLWTASDDLSRVVASNEEAGDPREDKYVGLFYFLCWVGAGIHVQDNTKIYLEKHIFLAALICHFYANLLKLIKKTKIIFIIRI